MPVYKCKLMRCKACVKKNNFYACPESHENVFTARRSYASAVFGVIILSVRLSVCPSVYHTRAL